MPSLQTSRLTTISHHIDEEQSMHPGATGEFTSILNDLTLALRIISRDGPNAHSVEPRIW